MEMIRRKLSLLPEKPGVYLMKDNSGLIIYVGKAKILKNRVRSYFTGSHDAKTQMLVSHITDFEYIITDTEVEALVLECNLIKKYNPRYNILLRDDKTYPYLLVTNEKHPRILVTRQIVKGKGRFFGPYPNAGAANEAARLLNRLFPFRKCRQLPNRPCLYYHLRQCLGPCINTIEQGEYDRILKNVISFLRGGQNKIIQWLEQEMLEAAESLHFERAKEYRELIEDLKRINEKQTITLTDFVDRDVIGYSTTTDQMCIQIFHLRQGKIIERDNFIFPYYEEAEEALISFIVQFYTENTILPAEILLPPIDTTLLIKLFPVIVPQKGKKLDLVQLAMKNASNALHDQITLEVGELTKMSNALEVIGDKLTIPSPLTIEAFDISHTSGTNNVAGMVHFENGKPLRSAYRKFKIREIEEEHADDTAAMKQVIHRRYSRLITEGSSLPDLILVDGGKGQVHAALSALNNLNLRIPVAGMVKDDCHRTSGLINSEGNLVSLEKSSSAFYLLERIQDEVHRFAITFHRQQRAKQMILSSLDGIPGIGIKRRQLLFRHFGSIDKIRSADIEDLQSAGIPLNIAQNLINYFKQASEISQEDS